MRPTHKVLESGVVVVLSCFVCHYISPYQVVPDRYRDEGKVVGKTEKKTGKVTEPRWDGDVDGREELEGSEIGLE